MFKAEKFLKEKSIIFADPAPPKHANHYVMGTTQNKVVDGEEEDKATVMATPAAPASPPGPLGSFRSIAMFAYQPGGPYPSHCGYCHSADERFCVEGVFSDKMSVHDFQNLVDKGFQRSGKFVYLPANKLTCCPQYVLRLDCSTFHISKEQRRAIRKMNEYLLNGKKEEAEGEGPDAKGTDQNEEMESLPTEGATVSTSSKPKKVVKPGVGADPNLPRCKKAKERRREAKEKKQAKKNPGEPLKPAQPTTKPDPTHVEDLLTLPDAEKCKHKLRKSLLCVNPVNDEFLDTYQQSYEVFRKFQMIIHKEPPEKCEQQHFDQFCIDSPLVQEEGPPGSDIKYGSYHQQYWIDDNLVMVGVVDILPSGVLCNYLYYDPYYRFIFPGVYSALCEISMNQTLYQRVPDLRYYYIGYYVHDCPKMNYKRKYDSCYLLCPITHRYVPLEVCRKKLDSAKYCRFSDEGAEEKGGEGELGEVLIASDFGEFGFIKYSLIRERMEGKLDDLVRNYVAIVGKDLAQTMILKIVGL